MGLLLVAHGCWIWTVYQWRSFKCLGLSFIPVPSTWPCSTKFLTLFSTCSQTLNTTTLYMCIHLPFVCVEKQSLFPLLMQAGISLARALCLDGTWQSLVTSFSVNASYIVSTVLWIYWCVHPLSLVCRLHWLLLVTTTVFYYVTHSYMQGCLY